MILKNKQGQKFISALIIILIIFPAVLFSRPKKAEALWPSISDFFAPLIFGKSVITAHSQLNQTALAIRGAAKETAKQALKVVARRFLQEMTRSTVAWINTGRWGNPLFLENPKSFFKDIAKSEIKNFVDLTGYDRLRFPFGKDFALQTINSYKRQFADNAEHSLSKVMTDPVLFSNFRSSFEVGGWNGFLINTQYPQNNYVGYQMLATEELARRLDGTATNAANTVRDTLQQGMGFLSPQNCPSNPNYPKATNPYNPPTFKSTIIYDWKNPPILPGERPEDYQDRILFEKADFDKTYNEALATERAQWDAKYDCPKGLQDTTPGALVADQIMTAFSSTYRQSETAVALGDSISAIMNALMNKLADKGLSALENKINPPAPTDNWDYYGNTLGTVRPYNQGSWDSGPDEEIVLTNFKNEVNTGIENTNTELKIMDNPACDPTDAVNCPPTNSNNPNNPKYKPGIVQMFGAIWPKAQELDMCLPGPNLGWQDRLTEEMNRNSQRFQQSQSSNNGETAALAQLASNELKFAVNVFKDWIYNKILVSIPGSINYIDSVDEIKTIEQEFNQLNDAKRISAQMLARLSVIKLGLDSINSQPTPDSSTEKIMIEFRKQYNAINETISNPITIVNRQGQLDILKDKYNKLNRQIAMCKAERKTKGMSEVGGQSKPLFSDGPKTEQEIFCNLPIANGYTHGPFINTKPVPDEYKYLPLVNAKQVLYSKDFSIDTSRFLANISLSCNIIFRSTNLDYKGNIPGTTNLIEPPPNISEDNDVVPVDNTPNVLTCSPQKQSVRVGQVAHFTAFGGDGNYSWTQSTGNPSSGIGTTWFTSWSQPSSQTEDNITTVTSAGLTAQCSTEVIP